DEAAAILARQRVAVVGAGSVGGRIALHLARQRLAAITIVDPARYKSQSVLTHEISPADVGRAKAEAVAARCQAISPGTVVTPHVARVQDLPVSQFTNCDLMVLSGDNLQSETAASEICARLAIPLVHAAVHGETLTAQVRFVAHATADGPCLACSYSADEWN